MHPEDECSNDEVKRRYKLYFGDDLIRSGIESFRNRIKCHKQKNGELAHKANSPIIL